MSSHMSHIRRTSTENGGKGSLYSMTMRSPGKQAKNKTHKSRRQKRQELISRLKPSNKDSPPLNHNEDKAAVDIAPPAADQQRETMPLQAKTTATVNQPTPSPTPMQQRAAPMSANHRSTSPEMKKNSVHVVTPDRRPPPAVSNDEMSDILSNVANDFVAKNLVAPANTNTKTVRKTMMQQTTKRTYAPTSIVDNNNNRQHQQQYNIEDQENASHQANKNNNNNNNNNFETNNYYYEDTAVLGSNSSSDSSHTSTSTSSSSVSFFDDTYNFNDNSNDDNKNDQGGNNMDSYGSAFSRSSSEDTDSISDASAHILSDLESTNCSSSSKLNLGARYAHLMKKDSAEKQKQEEEADDSFNSSFKSSGFGNFMNHPFVPLETSFDSSERSSELSVEQKDRARQANEERQNIAMNTLWESETTSAAEIWDPFHNSKVDAKPSAQYESFTRAKRTLSPDQPPKRMIKSPRSGYGNVVRTIPSLSSVDCSSINSDQHQDGRPQQFSDKIAHAFKALRPVTGDKKQQQRSIIRPPHAHHAKQQDEMAAEHRPKVSFAPSVRKGQEQEQMQTYPDDMSPAPAPANMPVAATNTAPHPQSVHIHHDDDETMSSASSHGTFTGHSTLPCAHEGAEESIAPAFDIKVALLGGRKAGKSTLLNAFFQEEFTGSSMSGVNYYVLSRNVTGGKQHIMHLQDKDNTVAVGKAGKRVEEHYFDVELGSNVLNEMRDDARLVFVDVPAFFPESSHYLDYLERKWDEMDCAIVVLDVMTTNSVENITIMNFVKHCLKKRKDLPIVIVCNKVDDTEDDELMAMVDSVRQESLAAILGEKSTEKVTNLAFIPISAKNASWYRSAAKLSFEQFKKLDKSKVDEMGREEIGRFRWKKLTPEEQYMAVYDTIQDEGEYKIRLRASNFDILMNSLDHFIGGKKKQDRIIRKQLETSLKKLSHEAGYYDRLESIYRQSLVLSRPTSHLKDTFWSLYSKSYNEAHAMFQKSPSHVATMHAPLQVLIRYSSELHEDLHRIDVSSSDHDREKVMQEKEQDAKKIVGTIKEAIKQQCSLIVEKAYQWKKCREERDGKAPTQNLPEHWAWDTEKEQWKNIYTGLVVPGNEDENPGFLLTSWDDMTPRDWITVIDSIMLMLYDRQFCENFGAEIAELKWLDRTGKFVELHYESAKRTPVQSIRATSSDDELDRMLNGDIVEKNNCEQLTNVMRISVPDSPSDAKHWGHVIWLFCAFMDNQEKKRQQAHREI